MGFLSKKDKRDVGKHVHQRSLPPDRHSLKVGPDVCHCVSESELNTRYSQLRVEEHARIEGRCGARWSRKIAEMPENEQRNRYGNILPWDHSRVVLPVQSGNDYINASWIQLGNRSYIAAQGPLAGTIPHFWHMVYAYGGDPAVICMLTPLHENGVEKCTKYWPDNKQDVIEVPAENFGFGIRVSFDKITVNDHYHYSTLQLQPTDSSLPEKTVHHIYYHSWLDYTRPNADADLRGLIFLINNTIRNPGAPLIVHCSAGIGRSGTFIAIDALMVDLDNELQSTVAPKVTPVWRQQLEFCNQATPFPGTGDNLGVQTHIEEDSDAVEDSFEDARDGDENRSSTPNVDIAKIRHSADINGIEEMVIESSSISPPSQASSALTGPVCSSKRNASSKAVDEKWLKMDPEHLPLLSVMDDKDDDVVLSVIRFMRMQRPKMVQGAQQLGYIYDQVEITEQLLRAHNRTERVTRRATVDNGNVNSTQKTERSNSTASSQKSSKSVGGRLMHRVNTFTHLAGSRRADRSASSASTASASTASATR